MSAMDVCLIDVDSKIPNLALMRASTYHKQRGDNVKLGYEPLLDHPELCYASKIFDFTYQKHLARWCNNKYIFKSTTFEDYEPWRKEQKRWQ